MVLQRQVPARPAAKAGEGLSAGDAADGGRNDTFSAALSQEKRSSAAERDKVQSGNQSETDSESRDADDEIAAGSGQSDEILSLLSGLKSSASYADDAEVGNPVSAEGVAPEGAAEEIEKLQTGDVLAEADGEPVDTTEGSVEKVDRAANAQPAASAANPAAALAGAEAPVRPAAPERTNGTQGPQTSDAATVARPETVPPAPAAKSAQGALDAKSTATPAQVASAASALAGQGAQVQPRATAASNGSDTQKDVSAVKEAMRTLGLESAPGLANANAAKAQARNAAMQNGADDRRLDELNSKKDGKIEVIESRRFMPAQNLSSNAQMLTRTLAEAGTNALAAQRAAPAQPLAQGAPQAGQTLHTLKLQLNPVSLGSVTAVLKLSGEDLSVEIKVQTAEAYRQLKEDNQSILKALRGQGFGVEQISVQHVVGNERVSNQTAQPGFQSSQQGAGSNDAQSFGKDGNRNSSGQQQSGGSGGHANEQGSYAGSGAGRTDGVYL